MKKEKIIRWEDLVEDDKYCIEADVISAVEKDIDLEAHEEAGRIAYKYIRMQLDDLRDHYMVHHFFDHGSFDFSGDFEGDFGRFYGVKVKICLRTVGAQYLMEDHDLNGARKQLLATLSEIEDREDIFGELSMEEIYAREYLCEVLLEMNKNDEYEAQKKILRDKACMLIKRYSELI